MSETLLTTLDARATVSLKEVAQRLGWSEWTVRRMANEGRIGGAFQGGKKRARWRFKRLELEAWYEKQGLAPGSRKPSGKRKGVAK